MVCGSVLNVVDVTLSRVVSFFGIFFYIIMFFRADLHLDLAKGSLPRNLSKRERGSC